MSAGLIFCTNVCATVPLYSDKGIVAVSTTEPALATGFAEAPRLITGSVALLVSEKTVETAEKMNSNPTNGIKRRWTIAEMVEVFISFPIVELLDIRLNTFR